MLASTTAVTGGGVVMVMVMVMVMVASVDFVPGVVVVVFDDEEFGYRLARSSEENGAIALGRIIRIRGFSSSHVEDEEIARGDDSVVPLGLDGFADEGVDVHALALLDVLVVDRVPVELGKHHVRAVVLFIHGCPEIRRCVCILAIALEPTGVAIGKVREDERTRANVRREFARHRGGRVTLKQRLGCLFRVERRFVDERIRASTELKHRAAVARVSEEHQTPTRSVGADDILGIDDDAVRRLYRFPLLQQPILSTRREPHRHGFVRV